MLGRKRKGTENEPEIWNGVIGLIWGSKNQIKKKGYFYTVEQWRKLRTREGSNNNEIECRKLRTREGKEEMKNQNVRAKRQSANEDEVMKWRKEEKRESRVEWGDLIFLPSHVSRYAAITYVLIHTWTANDHRLCSWVQVILYFSFKGTCGPRNAPHKLHMLCVSHCTIWKLQCHQCCKVQPSVCSTMQHSAPLTTILLSCENCMVANKF